MVSDSRVASTKMHPATLPAEVLLSDCHTTHTRRSGPGGQHRNKVQTAVILLHRPSGCSAEASERRSQSENHRVALKRLRLRLALEIRTLPESLEPTRLWQTRTHARQLKVSADHDDYPALVAEALNQLQVANWEMARVAGTLGISTSQLTKLFRRLPSAWVALNFCRATHGLPLLK